MTMVCHGRVIRSYFDAAQLEKRCLKRWHVLKSAPLYVPVHRVAMAIDIRRFFRYQRQCGTWLIDTLQPHIRTASERVDLVLEDISEGIVLTPELSSHEAPDIARRALLEQRFRFLTQPISISSEYLDTVYHPFMLLLAHKNNRQRLMVLDRITGEENLFLRARMQLPESLH
ncbi:hypothetical protein [Kushneria indalinina]|uniref:Uncharacterized protein n=1 Tax=Kushneria indalinina DSM 14324 TaxID=1122140 RepID=A0A3D9DYI5_9GAMM|nr:hypothetical protein [Kushneria indalinina]REC95324.1 hypothetical protein C8D72_2160 [Kushneria indalinina DSM 14324]